MESVMDNSVSVSQVDALEFLRPILVGLTEDDLKELAQAAVELFYPAGAVIIQEGDEGDAVYFDSSLRHRLLAAEGEEVQVLAVVTR